MVLCVFALTATGHAAMGAAESNPPAAADLSVLVVHGEDPYLPWVSEISAGIFRVLESAPPPRPEVYVEYLDLARFPSAAQAHTRSAWLREKYRSKRIDAILVVTRAALDYILPLARERWPGLPIVLLENERVVRNVELPAEVVPVLAHFEIGETLDLAKSLLPGTRRVAFVSGPPDMDVDETDDVRRELRARGAGMELIDLAGLPMRELQERVRNLPADSFVFYWSIRVDGEGRSFVPREALRQFAALSSRPIFSVHATMIGYGIVGGRVLDFGALGREGGRSLLKVLNGIPAASIRPTRRDFSRTVFDDRELERFQIPESRLPAGSEVQFRELSIFRRYPRTSVAALAMLAIQTVLIVELLVQRRRTRLAEDDSRERRRELAHAGRLTAVGELTASISHEINQPLGAILANAEAAEMLLAGEGNVEEVRRILSDIRRDDLRASEVVRRVRGLAGKRELELKPIDPNEVVASVIRLLAYEARRHGVYVESDLMPGLPLPRADEVSLQQVLINLALNGMEAMADAPPGKRRLRLATRPASDRVEFRVSDCGRGISDAERPRLFQSFFTTKEHGVGLGLSICRSIVERLGGAIGAESNPGGGATFWFSLPVEEARPAGRHGAAAGVST